MDYGSSHVWVYDDSDEEYFSECELNEGMWLSDSGGSDDEIPATGLTPMAAVHPSKLKKMASNSGSEDTTSDEDEPLGVTLMPGAVGELEGSATKYLQDEVGVDEDGTSPTAVSSAEPQSTLIVNNDVSKKIPKYVEVDPLLNVDEQPKSKSQPQQGYQLEEGNTSVEYAKLKPAIRVNKAARVEARKPIKVQSEPTRTVRVESPPPPSRPPKGIIKKKFKNVGEGLRRLKRQRVQVKVDKTDRSGNRRGRRNRQADTNVLAVKFNKLTDPSNIHTGDAVVCGNAQCTALLSHLSKLSDNEDTEKDEKVWVCEFCGTKNEVDIISEEIPSKSDTTFIISPAPVSAVGGATGASMSVEDSLVVFCIDVSGSMCVTTEVPGKFELKGHDRLRSLASLNEHGEDQFLPRQRKDVTYVSRLQSVQAAVDHQLTQLTSTFPSQRVALVTFSDEVTVIGDGRSQTLTMAGDKLWNIDALVKVGEEAPMPAPIKDTRKALSEKVFSLEEGGQTALGPALLVSISIASRVPGSKVIICTDGLANKGVGNLDGLSTQEAKDKAQSFYEDMGDIALDQNVTVSLVRIKGTDCKAVELGQVSNKTGGQVTIVNPLNITKEFSSILANPIIATNVKTRIVLHSGLYFRTEETGDSVLMIPVGNVTADTELTYEYGVRTEKNHSATTTSDQEKAGASASALPTKVPPLTINGKTYLPFQLQIEYTAQDGSRNRRVITDAKPITKERQVAERDIHLAVVGTHAAHTSAKLAMEGEYTEARVNAFSKQRLLQRTSHLNPENRLQYTNLMVDLIPMENELQRKQTSEVRRFGRRNSDDSGEEEMYVRAESELTATKLPHKAASESAQLAPRPAKKMQKKKALRRRGSIDDDLAMYIYNMSTTTSAGYENLEQEPPQDDSEEED